jgi:recombination protein RecA
MGVFFGTRETTPGGRALKFYSSVRIDIRRIESLKIGQQVVGNRVRTRVVKNKVAAPFRQAEFDLMFTGKTTGISREGDILDLGVEYEIVKKLGAFYSYGEQRLGQGREKARDYLIENPALGATIETEIRAAAKAAASSPSAKPKVKVVEDDEEEPEDEA